MSALYHPQAWQAAVLVCCMLAGCQSIDQSKLTPAAAAGTPSWNSNPMAALPPPASRAGWLDSQVDVLNQRAIGFGLVRMPAAQAYLDEIYTRIKTEAGVADWPGHIYITAAPTLEAGSTAAGNIYVSMAWLNQAQHEDELAALLGHEFGHVYMHYHQLQGAILTSDTVANVASVGVALTNVAAMGGGWTPVDSLLVSYQAAKGLGVSSWARTQETAADYFGLSMSLRLGYSYDNGIKTMLEHLAAQEAKLDAEQRNAAERQLEADKAATREAACKKSGNSDAKGNCNLSGKIEGSLNAGLQSVFSVIAGSVKKAAGKVQNDHPETAERQEQIAVAADKLSDAQLEGRNADHLSAARAVPETARILANYKLAVKAFLAPDAPDALDLARQATAGPTATHALPVMALYRAQLARPFAPLRKEYQQDPGLILETNLKAPEDVSWAVVQERALQLHAKYRQGDAKQVLKNGFAYFSAGGNVWPDAIRFVGQNEGWPQAKNLAQECSRRFPEMGKPCTQAAVTPAEQAEIDARSKQKAEKIVQGWNLKK